MHFPVPAFLLVAVASLSGGASADAADSNAPPRIVVSQMEGNDESPLTAASPPAVHQLALSSPLFTAVITPCWWSLVEPRESQYRFDLLDQQLSYWDARQKKVILSPCAAGFPMPAQLETGAATPNAPPVAETPAWVMKRCQTHSYLSRVFHRENGVVKETAAPVDLAAFWDPKFYQPYQAFIRALGAKYDHDPRVGIVRIGMGMMNEEKPNVRRGRALPIGYTNQRWYDYCRLIVQTYAEAFPDKELEGCLVWAPYEYTDTKDNGRAEVLSLLAEMRKDHVVLGYTGWDATDPAKFDPPSNPNRIWDLLRLYHRQGGDVAFETAGWITKPTLQDTQTMLKWAQILRPVHINFYWLPQSDFAWGEMQHRCQVEHLDPVELAQKYVTLIQSVRQLREGSAP